MKTTIQTGINDKGQPVIEKIELTRTKAIKYFCMQCYGYDELNQVKNCPSTTCPLWVFRGVVSNIQLSEGEKQRRADRIMSARREKLPK